MMSEAFRYIVYVLCGTLAFLSFHRLILVWLMSRIQCLPPLKRKDALPKVLVQVPLYNEPTFCHRIIRSVCSFDYPVDLLEIQILDDSTDETTYLVEDAVRFWREQNINVSHLRRDQRDGFKAGALSFGMRLSNAPMIAVFDADFVPTSEFLLRAVPYFENDNVGMVQARWGHLNAEQSFLTRAQRVLLDCHFNIEHRVRNELGWFFNFNGTAGIWRREAIKEAGGWSDDTVTEDLDLSIRASMQGWGSRYIHDLVVPATLPDKLSAWRTQQDRWVCGGIQTAKKYLKTGGRGSWGWFLSSDDRLAILLQNFSYFPLCFLLLLLPWYPFVVIRSEVTQIEFIFGTFLLLTGFLPIACFFWLGMSKKKSWFTRVIDVCLAFSLSSGLVFNNFRAALRGLVSQQKQVFNRTPKGDLECTREHKWQWFSITEGLVGCFYCSAFIECIKKGFWGITPFIALMGFGFLYCACFPLKDYWNRGKSQRRHWPIVSNTKRTGQV